MAHAADTRVVDRLAEFRALSAKSAPLLIAPVSVAIAPAQNVAKSPQKKSLMGRLFGDSKEEKKTAPPPVVVDNSAALEKYFAEVEVVMIAIHEAQATLDSLEPQCLACA